MVEITTAQDNQRLDNFLFKVLKNVPRTRVYRIVRKGEVRVNKKRCKPDYRLQIGDHVRIPPFFQTQGDSLAAPKIPRKRIEQLGKAIIFENEHILVIDKPSGLAVHTGSGIAFGVIDIMRELREGTDIELVHRLDRDTSGCLLFAKHRQSLLAMQRCLQDNSLVKTYYALVNGYWPDRLVDIRHPLKKIYLSNGERRTIVDEQGKPAISRFKSLDSREKTSLVEILLVTGRTHQIRVHCQAEGHPICGDEKYGDNELNRELRQHQIRRLMLHASTLKLPSTEFTAATEVVANLPPEFQPYLGKTAQ